MPGYDHADAQAQEAVELAHPVGVALRQVVVDGDDVHALACQRVQVHRQRGDQRLAFAGAHLGDLALVQRPCRRSAARRSGACPARGARLRGTTAKASGRILSSASPSAMRFWNSGVLAFSASSESFFKLRFQRVDLADAALELLEQAFVATAEDAGEQTVDHVGNRIGKERRARPAAWCPLPPPKRNRAQCALSATHYCSLGRPPKESRRRPVGAGLARELLARCPKSSRARPAPTKSAQPRLILPTGVGPSPRNLRGLTTPPFSQTSKCTCAPVERPVEPALAISWPTRTRSPTRTTRRELCA